MKLNRPTRRHHPETIVALIDVVFFLLVFFMLIGRMDATSPFDVLPPISQNGSDLPAGGYMLAVGANGELALNGMEIEKSALPEAISIALALDPDVLFKVNAHMDVELRHVLPMVAKIEQLGVREVVLVVTPNPP